MRFILACLLVALSLAVPARGQKQVQRGTGREEPVLAQGQKQVQLSMSKEEMLAKRKEIEDAIKETEAQLERLKSDKKATMGELRALQDKLAQRQRLIENINSEMADIDNNIRSSNKEVLTLTQQLEQLKLRYAQSVRYSYENRSSYDMLAFLFSSRDFNDAMRRMKYLKKFRDFRKLQVDQIRATQDNLHHKIDVLKNVQKQKDDLLSKQVEQKQVLEKETNETNNVIQELKGKENELMKTIAKNKETARRVDHYIQIVIQNEILKAQREAEEKRKKEEAEQKKKEAELAKNNPPANNNNNNPEHPESNARTKPKPKVETQPLLSTPTDIALENNFEGNRGKMYWPVEKGVISDHFGVHPHPLAPQVMIDNTGIDIQTSSDATVKAVFEGTVTSVSTVENMMVLIKSGDYMCVYNNLKSVSVSKGQHVNTNQAIGVVAENADGVPTVKFQIWKMGRKAVHLNPEVWLGKAR